MPSDASEPAVGRESSPSLGEAWAGWIAGMGEWHLFGGLTYDQRRARGGGLVGVQPGADVVKAHAVRWIKDFNRGRGRPIEAAVVALEYQKNGWPHLHPLLRIAGGLQGDEIKTLGGLWYREHGGNKLEVPRTREDVCAYASKYLVKDLARGDVVLWPLRGPLTSHQPSLP